MTLHQTAERDGTGWKRAGSLFASHSKEMSAKVAFRKGFLLGEKRIQFPAPLQQKTSESQGLGLCEEVPDECH